MITLSKESEIEWKFQSEGGDIGFGVQKKLARCFLSCFLWLLLFWWWHWWWFVGMVNLSRLVSRLQPSAQRGHDPTSVQKRPETGETTKSLWLRKVSRNRKTDQIAFPVSRHFLYSGDFVVSPVPRHFWTDVGSGPLWAEPEIEKRILGHEKVKIPWIRRQMTRVQNCENAMVVILIVSGWTASLVQERESWRRRRRPRASKRTLTPLPRMSLTWPGSVRDSFLE